ncbi:MAG: RimK-like ATPgrasp N-terminal domain-containing protein, partial [Ignavibacteriae bacterium]|nr:RimK-like ATPgrasp N-terminal domain-containing protein [Ignavibacteriota bacterium]
MRKIIIVNNPNDWNFEIDSVEVIDAKSYLTKHKFSELKNVRIFNLCRNYKYQSTGYYVSLLAEARGHKVIPSVTTMVDFRTLTLIKSISEELDAIIQASLAKIKSESFTLSIYFGQNISKKHAKLAKGLYNLFQAPLLRAEFRFNKKWHLKRINPISVTDINDDHLPYIEDFAQQYFSKKRFDTNKTLKTTYDLAILHDPKASDPPSNETALHKMIAAAEKIGFYVELITKEDYNRIPEFDALFI